ncbi:proteasome pci domain-containing protein [Cyclospora cayetanensis]|uniref:Proteasome pci domain-containing protein n=1 Tax=Cyclospora cayetanensis TaxID=88456 RepID=A0A1D3D3L1_9EIME|nr:proteasome pci domain-containing protein [Cyclospora cayetanensis]
MRLASRGRVHRSSRSSNQQTEGWAECMLQAVVDQNGEAFSDLIKEMDSIIPQSEILNMPETVMSAILQNKLRALGLVSAPEAAFKRLLLEFLRLRQLSGTCKWGEVVRQCVLLLSLYVDVYVEVPAASCGWLVPGLAVLCNLMNRAALAADAATDDSQEMLEETEGAAEAEEAQNRYTKEVLNAIRPKLGKVRGEEGRHGAYVVLLGQSIKRCLQLGNMQMAAGFLKLCDSRQINFSHAPRGPMVNFRYYLGRLYMQQEQFEQVLRLGGGEGFRGAQSECTDARSACMSFLGEAVRQVVAASLVRLSPLSLQSESELVWAFSNCPSLKMRVRRNILECLVAARLRLGKLPSAALLQKYQMAHYLGIIKAMKTGNLSLFDKAMEENESIFIKHGTILCIERLKFIVFRTMMKRMKEWWVKSGLASKANIVPIQVFTAAIKWQTDDLFDDDEVSDAHG